MIGVCISIEHRRVFQRVKFGISLRLFVNLRCVVLASKENVICVVKCCLEPHTTQDAYRLTTLRIALGGTLNNIELFPQ